MGMNKPKISRMSRTAVICLFFLGVFSWIFVEPTLGIALILLSLLLYFLQPLLVSWLLRRAEKLKDNGSAAQNYGGVVTRFRLFGAIRSQR
jgi:hypothetical protein